MSSPLANYCKRLYIIGQSVPWHIVNGCGPYCVLQFRSVYGFGYEHIKHFSRVRMRRTEIAKVMMFSIKVVKAATAFRIKVVKAATTFSLQVAKAHQHSASKSPKPKTVHKTAGIEPLLKRFKFHKSDEEILLEAKSRVIERLNVATCFDAFNIPSRPTSASLLKASFGDGTGSENFQESSILQETAETLQRKYIEDLFSYALKYFEEKKITLTELLHSFDMDVFKCLHSLNHEIENEAELRFAYGDPLIRLFATLDQKRKVSTSVQSFPP